MCTTKGNVFLLRYFLSEKTPFVFFVILGSVRSYPPNRGIQQAIGCKPIPLEFHHRRVLRRPRFRCGSIIVTVICHRSHEQHFVISRRAISPLLRLLRAVAYRFSPATTETYLLKVYAIINDHKQCSFQLKANICSYYITSFTICQEVNKYFNIFNYELFLDYFFRF